MPKIDSKLPLQKIGLFLFIYLPIVLIVGVFSSVYVDFIGSRYTLLAAIPVLAVLTALFIIDRHFFFLLILLIRSAIDPILQATKLGGIGLGAVLNALIIMLAMIEIISPKNSQFEAKKKLKETIWIWAPFIIIYSVSILYSPQKVSVFRQSLGLVSIWAMFYLGSVLVQSSTDLTKWLKVVFFSSVIPVIWGCYQLISGGHQGIYGSRILATFTHPNVFAFYLVLVIAIGFYFFKSQSNRPRYALPMYLLVLLAFLLLTQTRSAWVGLFALLGIYALLYERKYLFLLILLPIVGMLVPEVRERILDLTSSNQVVMYAKLNSYAWRKYLWDSAVGWMSISHYLTGYGGEAFKHFSVNFFPLADGIGRDAHNVYVQVFFETGVLGLLAYLWLYGSVGVRMLRLYKYDKLVVFVIGMLLVDYLLFSYSDNMLYYLNINWYYWFVFGAVLSYLRVKKSETSSGVNVEKKDY